MTKRKFAIIGSIILLATTMMTFGVSAVTTPVCASALNFCALGTDSGEYSMTANVIINNQTQTMPSGVYAWDSDMGGVIIDDMPIEFPARGRNIQFKLRIEDLDGYLPFLPHRNTESHYYANAILCVRGYNANGEFEQAFAELNSLTLFDSEGNITTGDFSPINNNYFNYDRISALELVFTMTTAFSSGLTTDDFLVSMFTIYQDIQVEFSENWGDDMQHVFVPYVQEWFNGSSSEEYQNGYNAGYAIGYEEGDVNGFVEGYEEGFNDGKNYIPSEVVDANWTDFVFNALNGVLKFELLPGLPLWGMLSAVVAIPLLIMFLKMFMGG